MDATCVSANIRYPQYVSLLNEAREKLEAIIYRFCKSYGLSLPRCYRRHARKDYLAFAKSKTLLWYGLYSHQTGRTQTYVYRIICIRDEPV